MRAVRLEARGFGAGDCFERLYRREKPWQPARESMRTRVRSKGRGVFTDVDAHVDIVAAGDGARCVCHARNA